MSEILSPVFQFYLVDEPDFARLSYIVIVWRAFRFFLLFAVVRPCCRHHRLILSVRSFSARDFRGGALIGLLFFPGGRSRQVGIEMSNHLP